MFLSLNIPISKPRFVFAGFFVLFFEKPKPFYNGCVTTTASKAWPTGAAGGQNISMFPAIMGLSPGWLAAEFDCKVAGLVYALCST